MVDWSFLPVVERVLFILRRIDIARVEAKNRIPKLSRSGILYYVCVCVDKENISIVFKKTWECRRDRASVRMQHDYCYCTHVHVVSNW